MSKTGSSTWSKFPSLHADIAPSNNVEMARHAGQPGRAEQPAGHVCRGLGSDVEGPRSHVQTTPGHSDGGEVADGFVQDCNFLLLQYDSPEK